MKSFDHITGRNFLGSPEWVFCANVSSSNQVSIPFEDPLRHTWRKRFKHGETIARYSALGSNVRCSYQHPSELYAWGTNSHTEKMRGGGRNYRGRLFKVVSVAHRSPIGVPDPVEGTLEFESGEEHQFTTEKSVVHNSWYRFDAGLEYSVPPGREVLHIAELSEVVRQ